MTTTPLSRAATLPSRYYLEPANLEREKELVFGRTWQLVARAEELQRVGDFVPVTILDEPIVITHGLDGELRGFYNVCRHRAGQVALTRGNRKSLQCRYHGWTYGLDGTLRACPEMEETEDFRKEDFGLMPVRVDRWGPFVFACLSADAPPLPEVMGAIPDEVARAGFDMDRMRLVERREYLVECNWKVYVDNYLEGYHLPIAHPQLFRELDYDAYRVEEFLPGQHVLERDPAAERGPYADDLRVVLRRSGHRAGLGVDAADDRLQRRDPAGGHRHLRAGPAWAPLPLLRLRPLLGQARERRLPLPEPGPRVPGGGDLMPRLDRPAGVYQTYWCINAVGRLWTAYWPRHARWHQCGG
ncbi:MAG: aromatic ring-hydroxylating dioxygenase subunit alpha [Chloroflexota bacterium]